LLGALAALGLCVVFAAAFAWLQIFLGLVSGSAQAAQGISFSVFPLIFVSSAYVPVESMPGWLQPIAENQPVTAMVGAARALVLGGDTEALLGHSTTWFVVRALVWSAVILVRCPSPRSPSSEPVHRPAGVHQAPILVRVVRSAGSVRRMDVVDAVHSRSSIRQFLPGRR
jgi:hypothetical protein